MGAAADIWPIEPSTCLPQLKPLLARMNPSPFIRSRSAFRRRNTNDPQHIPRSEPYREDDESLPPPRTTMETRTPSPPARISDSDSDKEVYVPQKSVVARILSPEHSDDTLNQMKKRATSAPRPSLENNATTRKSPSPSYKTLDLSSSDPEVVPAAEDVSEYEWWDEKEFVPEQSENNGNDGEGSGSGGEDLASDDDESEFELYLPLQDCEGRDIRAVNARLDRPPSWEFGVHLWTGSGGDGCGYGGKNSLDISSRGGTLPTILASSNADMDSRAAHDSLLLSPVSPLDEKDRTTFPFSSIIGLDAKRDRRCSSWRDSVYRDGWM